MLTDSTFQMLETQEQKIQQANDMEIQLIEKLYRELLAELKQYVPATSGFFNYGHSEWLFTNDIGEKRFEISCHCMKDLLTGEKNLISAMKNSDWADQDFPNPTYNMLVKQFDLIPDALRQAIIRADEWLDKMSGRRNEPILDIQFNDEAALNPTRIADESYQP